MIYLFGAIVLSLVIFAFLGFDPRKNTWKRNRKQFLSFLGLIVILFGTVTQVDANEVGIVYDPFRGGIQDSSLQEGLHFKSIFQEITHISTTNRTALLEVAGQTKDSIYAVFAITLVYRIESVNAGLFYKKVGNNDIPEQQLNSLAKEALQSATTLYDIYSILGEDLETVRLDFVNKLQSLLMTRYNITVVSASFDDIDAGSRIEEIIQNKAEAIQLIEIAEREKQRSEVEAQTAIIRANNEAQVAIIIAEGNATAQVILNSVTVNAINSMFLSQFSDGENTSTPEAYGYLSMQEISTIIIKQLYYDTWDGKLPTVITDASGIIISP